MDIFRTQTHRLISKGFFNLQSCVEHFYHGWMHFTFIIKLGRARTFLNITPIVFV